MPLTSALDFDNVKESLDIELGGSFIIGEKQIEYNPIWETYLPIEIKDWFGLGDTLFQGVLTQHDEVCGVDCQSTMQIHLAEDSVLIDDINFYTLQDDDSWVEQDIGDYQFYIDDKPYSLGEEVLAGTYEVRLDGQKSPKKTVDWVITTQGENLDSWAVWGPDMRIDYLTDLSAYFPFNQSAGTNAENIINASADGYVTDGVWTAGKFGNAINFSTTVVNFSNYLQLDEEITVQAWVNFNDTPATFKTIAGKLEYTGAGDSDFWGLYWQGGAFVFGLSNGTGGSDSWQNGRYTLMPIPNVWYHVVGTYNGTNVYVYVNGTIGSVSENLTGPIRTDTRYIQIGKAYHGTNFYFEGAIDEVGFWNKSFNDTEILYLYGNAETQYADFNTSLSFATLNSPVDYFNSSVKELNFSCSANVSVGSTLTNISLWHNFTGAWALNQTNIVTGKANSTTFNLTLGDIGDIDWSCEAGDNDGYSGSATTNRTINVNYMAFVNSETYNSTTYETATEGFRINITSDGIQTVLANFSYNGTIYPATKVGNNSEMEFYKDFGSMPEISTATATNHSFFWEVYYGTQNINTTENNQSVGRTVFGLCNATLTTPYINFTFEDEETTIATNATIDSSTWYYWLGDGTVNKSLLYSTTNANESYGFCFTPTDKTMKKTLALQYSDAGYPQRRWTSTTSLTNTTTNQKLYMLESADGTYSVYQVQTSVGGSISGVKVQAERQFSGVWTLVEEGTTDSAGGFTGWLNPDYDHRITFTKSGYTSVTVTIRPSSSTYTVVMTSGVEDATYNSSMEGLSWKVYPDLGKILFPNTTQIFLFNITANLSNIVACKMEIINNNSVSLGTTTGCNAQGGNLSLLIPLGTNRSVRAIYSVDIGDGYFILDADAYWIVMETNIPERGTIVAFFKYSKNLNEFGSDDNRQEYSRIVLFFFFLAILMASISITTGWDLTTSGGSLIFMNFIILISSYAGFLTLSYTGVNGWMDKYVVALITSLFTIGFILNKLSRET